jgi:ABC-type lipoprotein release transport system permease subunit
MPSSGVIFLARRFLSGRRRGGRGRLVGAIVGVALSVIPLVVVQQVAEGMIAADRRSFHRDRELSPPGDLPGRSGR